LSLFHEDQTDRSCASSTSTSSCLPITFDSSRLEVLCSPPGHSPPCLLVYRASSLPCKSRFSNVQFMHTLPCPCTKFIRNAKIKKAKRNQIIVALLLLLHMQPSIIYIENKSKILKKGSLKSKREAIHLIEPTRMVYDAGVAVALLAPPMAAERK
jgi:hypothetical protein